MLLCVGSTLIVPMCRWNLKLLTQTKDLSQFIFQWFFRSNNNQNDKKYSKDKKRLELI